MQSDQCDPQCAACQSVPGPRLDQVGAAASCLCAVHCAGGALLTLAAPFPLAGEIFDSPQVEAALVVAAAAIALHSVRRGYGWHRDRGVLVLVAIGLSLLGAARWIGAPPALELAVSVLGSACLVAGHAGNAYRLRQAALATRPVMIAVARAGELAARTSGSRPAAHLPPGGEGTPRHGRPTETS